MGSNLHSNIIHSTVWRESDHVRIVWITMLAMCDKYGYVEASLPGLADASRVTIEQCRDALNQLSLPDEHSRNPDNEGRRIKQVRGGWKIINHLHYNPPLDD